MSLKSITPEAAQALLDQGAVLVDIRGADEYARERIGKARHIPMQQLAGGAQRLDGATAVIFHCRSGARTRANAQALQACAKCDAYMLEGGLDAWKKAGLPLEIDKSRPLELQRQVQIAAGSIVLLGAILGAVASPWFHLLSAFVGAGLVFAGISGFCGMARVLTKMPWNREARIG
ncbi:rhodanese family protein [Candidimonas nitroreducens]|uniref:Rhodanese domain-containing protein n=1 Tax=Candidimonas nitroreducens TaxID=683354 RepID=A0A225MFM2_9BURK|nr:rhodanese family protein [Candidimonas nitroreducens]OWT60146.1 hypothetical protein CEY11_10755 [Candidimonas nitroreducens]